LGEERLESGLRRNVAFGGELFRPLEQRGLGRIAPDGSERREIVERFLQCRGRYPLSAPGSGGACFGASLVSVGRFAVTQSTMPPFSAQAL